MESSRNVFLRMSEEFYLNIPDEVRGSYLTGKIANIEIGDWNENMQDEMFEMLTNKINNLKKIRDERQYFLREQRRAKR